MEGLADGVAEVLRKQADVCRNVKKGVEREWNLREFVGKRLGQFDCVYFIFLYSICLPQRKGALTPAIARHLLKTSQAAIADK